MKTFLQFISEGSFASSSVQPWSGSVHSGQSIEDIYKTAVKKAEAVKPRLEQILKRATSGASKIMIGIKTYSSFTDKVLNRGRDPGTMYDVLRAAVLTDTQDEAKEIVANLKRTQKIVEIEFKDKGSDLKFGYFGSYHLRIVVNDLIIEVQVMTRRLWTYKEWGHEFYNQFRSLGGEPDPSIQRASKQVFALGNMRSFIPNKKRIAKYAYAD